MDKSWMQKGRGHHDYIRGCDEFITFAWAHRTADLGENIYCPCISCNNGIPRSRKLVREHILRRGITRTYTCWTKHGEAEVNVIHNEVPNATEGHDMHGLLRDSFPASRFLSRDDDVSGQPNSDGESQHESVPEEPNVEAQKFYKLLKEAETPLYPGCKTATNLSFLVSLLHLKCSNKMSNKAFDEHLSLLSHTYPESSIPKNFYEAKKKIRDLGMECIKIDACPNDCMLYWKGLDREKNKCDVCGESRWIKGTGGSVEEVMNGSRKIKRKAAKVLRYFPLKPRLQRLFMCSKTSKEMIWHAKGRTKDGILRHPADTEAWKSLNQKFPEFGSEHRNVRLGLASDGFNPFGTMSTSHSTWPVFVIPYNLPPWMCMKQPNFIMCLLIPGPKGPGNNIDVYLQPLIEELKELWTVGVETYDANSHQNFRMHAALLWTINDFPAYANLSGWSTKGYLACPCCHKFTSSERLRNGKKCVYLGHRRFLPIKHRFRDDTSSFNGRKEKDKPPKPLTGDDVLRQFRGYHQITFGKSEHDRYGNKRRPEDDKLPYNWRKISIFFQLPYWKYLLLRHNIDVMHTEKNNSESWVGTLLNIEGKTKDNLKARLDMEVMGIRSQLHAKPLGNNKFYLPSATHTLNLDERRKLCEFLSELKVPDGYSSNISRHVQVQECKIPGLKSHDWHVLMQQLLPVAARGILHNDVTKVLVEYSNFYKQLCSKALDIKDLQKLEKQISLTLCKMEMIFPPAFFDIMTHLPIHLAREAMIAGPVHYRWMYPVERYLYTLKQYVRNKSRPEGSIAQGYLLDECLTFISRYFGVEVNTKFNQLGRNSDDDFTAAPVSELRIFKAGGRSLGKETHRPLTDEEWEQARIYVLSNCEELSPFIVKHKQKILDGHGGNILPIDLDRIHAKEFGKWFESHVQKMKQKGEVISSDIENLSLGPKRFASCFKGYIVNGFRFHTAEHEKFKKTQNSGVFLSAETSSFDTGNNTSPSVKNVEYYGVLDDIVALQYREGRQIFLYKCRWWSVKSPGKKIDEFGFKSLDFTRTIAKDEPFILAKQALQVFYVKDNRDKNRRIVLHMQPRDFFDMGIQEVVLIQEESSRANDNATTTNENETATVNAVEVDNWTRNDIEGEEVIRSTAANDDDLSDDSDSDHSDYLSDCEQDDLI